MKINDKVSHVCIEIYINLFFEHINYATLILVVGDHSIFKIKQNYNCVQYSVLGSPGHAGNTLVNYCFFTCFSSTLRIL